MKMKIILVVAFGIFGLMACSPIPYKMTIDVKQNASDVDLKISPKDISIFAFSSAEDKDSALVASVAFGVAEKMELDRSIAAGSIPAYTVRREEVDPSGLASLAYAASFIDSDILILIDSLSVGDYLVERVPGRTYSDAGDELLLVKVILPFDFKVGVFDVDSLTFLYSSTYSDSLVWKLFTQEQLSEVRLISEANLLLKKSFNELGQRFASLFSPQWQVEDRLVILYNNPKWLMALDYAEGFQWQKAIDIWMEEVKSGNPKKSASAAYNVALACEMLEDYDLAIKWIDYAATKYYFREIEELRRRCELLMGGKSIVMVGDGVGRSDS